MTKLTDSQNKILREVARFNHRYQPSGRGSSVAIRNLCEMGLVVHNRAMHSYSLTEAGEQVMRAA